MEICCGIVWGVIVLGWNYPEKLSVDNIPRENNPGGLSERTCPRGSYPADCPRPTPYHLAIEPVESITEHWKKERL